MATTLRTFKLSSKPLSVAETGDDGRPISPATKALVAAAERLRQQLKPLGPKERIDMVRTVIDSGEDAMGVWLDAAAGTGGVSMHPIKSGPIMRQFAEGDESPSADANLTERVAGIPCVDEKQAVKLQSAFGNEVSYITPKQLKGAIETGKLLWAPMPSKKQH